MRGVYCQFPVKRSDEHQSLSQYFRAMLQNAEGVMVILFPRYDFRDWAKEFILDTLGAPEYQTASAWFYPDRNLRLLFVHETPTDVDCESGRIRGLPAEIPVLVCDGALTDNWLGVVR